MRLAEHAWRELDRPWLLTPIGPLTPGSACPHHGPLPEESRGVCAVCHATGARLQSRLDVELREARQAEARSEAERQAEFRRKLWAARQAKLGRRSA